ncbi:hypothetical protein ES288_D04G061500v1 [Gossypium darwinii]|uniref:Uncharacterized protein n=1 Tax=Gossypium darwinii TaxID=34276 RepID=A0A5D2CTM9_GOSDA|nr:hypothetical protein ES288_D04G061500v1 [Gossypium darwinii]
MAFSFRAMLFFMATLLVVSVRVESSEEEEKIEAPRTPTTPWNSPRRPSPPVKSIKDCIPYCRKSCIFRPRTNLCMNRCMPCCNRCKCLPPGTYINRWCGKCP